MERKKKFKKRKRHAYQKDSEVEFRVRTPREGEVLGIVEVRLGYGKSNVRCIDGKTRICRVPGAIRCRLWVRPGDIVLVKPWEFEGDKKGDILYAYKKHEAEWLKRHGYLKDLFDQEEF